MTPRRKYLQKLPQRIQPYSPGFMLQVLLLIAPDDISQRITTRTLKSSPILFWMTMIIASLWMILLQLLISRCQQLSLFLFISNLITRKTVMHHILFAFRKTTIRLRKVRHSNHQSPVLLDARLTDALRGVVFCLPQPAICADEEHDLHEFICFTLAFSSLSQSYVQLKSKIY